MSRRTASWLLLFVAALTIGGVWLVSASGTFGSFGTNDFIEYWTAYGAGRGGANPYSASQMLREQRGLGWRQDVPLMMWNPPWTLFLFAPILTFSFETASKLFLLLNIVCIVLAAKLGSDVVAEKDAPAVPPWQAVLAVLVSFPVWNTLHVGQMSLVLTVAVFALWRALRTSDLLSGPVALALLSIKPHLFLLPALIILWVNVRRRALLRLIPRGVLLNLLLLFCVQLFAPAAVRGWLGRLRGVVVAEDVSAQLVGVFDWRSATLVGGISGMIPGLTEGGHKALMVLISGAAAVALLLCLKVYGNRFRFASWAAPVTCLSIATAPFGWVFDASATVLAQLRVLALRNGAAGDPGKRREATTFLLTFGVIQLTALAVYHAKLLRLHHEFFLYPVVMFLVSLLAELRLGRVREKGAALDD